MTYTDEYFNIETINGTEEGWEKIIEMVSVPTVGYFKRCIILARRILYLNTMSR